MSEMAIAVDMGGSHVQCGIVEGRRVLASAHLTVREAVLAAVLPEVVDRVRALVREAGVAASEMAGVAVGICAIVDGESRVAATNGKYDDGVGFDFGRWAREEFGVRGVAENDTRVALLGEQFAGAAEGVEDAALITLGTGIGGAVMLGGRLLRSGGNRAGGLAGHLGVDWRGRLCSCGNRGCAEAEASTVALDAICRERREFAGSRLAEGGRKVDFRELFAAVDAGDGLAREVLDRCLGVWAALTVSVIHAYEPRVVVFGGGVMAREEAILPAIREHVERHAWAVKGSVKIVGTRLHSSAGLLGALPLLRGRA